MTSRSRKALIAILLLHSGLLAYSAYRHSPSNDETGHLVAGLSHWRFQRFELFAVNPPLVRGVAVLPLLPGQFNEDWQQYSSSVTQRAEFGIGAGFIKNNPDDFRIAFAIARWMLIPFSLLGAVTCFIWAGQMFGPPAGWVALLLWCFSPTVLAFGAMVTPDVGAAALGITVCHRFWRWLHDDSWKQTMALGLLLGATMLTKFTWVVLYPLFPVLWLCHQVCAKPGDSSSVGRRLCQMTVAMCVSLYVINVGYGFDRTLTPLGEYEFSSRVLNGHGHDTATWTKGNRFANSWMGSIPVPLPKNVLLGMDHVKHEYEAKYWSYLRGEHRKGGWWYYYLYAMATKMPLGTLALIGLGFRGLLFRPWPPPSGLLSLVPGLVVLVLVSSQTGFNHHLRYVLPAFPFLFVVASSAVRLLNSRHAWVRAVPVILLASAIASSSFRFPHGMSYFNEAVGGPANGWKHLGFSNIDWGQDMYELQDWYQSHPQARPLRVLAKSPIDHSILGFTDSSLNDALSGSVESGGESFEPGWYALGFERMLQQHSKVKAFLDEKPYAEIGYSMRIYKLDRPLPVVRWDAFREQK